MDCDIDTAPAITVIVGEADVTALPPSVALMVLGVPAVEAVKRAVYVPFPLSVTSPIVPLEVPPPVNENATVSPPVVRSFPFASLVRRVIAVTAPDPTVDGEIVMMD